MRVSGVRIEGAKQTRPSFLSRVISPYLEGPSYSDSTLQTVLHQTRQITHALHRTELFKSISPELATPRSSLASASDVDIVFRCQERGRLALKSATEFGDNDASAVSDTGLIILVRTFTYQANFRALRSYTEMLSEVLKFSREALLSA